MNCPAIDVCVKYSLRHRRRDEGHLDEGWMETVNQLETKVYEAAAARARNYERFWARQAMRRASPAQSSGPNVEADSTGSASDRAPGQKRPRENPNQGVEEPPGDDTTSLVTSRTSSSRTPRRPHGAGGGGTGTGERVTESTVWLTPRGALHSPPDPPTTPHGPASTDEAIGAWMDLLGFCEDSGDSLPTNVPEWLQTAIEENIAALPSRARGLMRRSLPLCLNHIQDEIIQIMDNEVRRIERSQAAAASGAASSSRGTDRKRRGGSCHNPARNRDAEGRDDGNEVEVIQDEPTSGSGPSRRGREGVDPEGTADHERTVETEDDMVEVVLDREENEVPDEEGDSDSTMWVQTSIQRSGSSSTSPTDGSPGTSEHNQVVWGRHHSRPDLPTDERAKEKERDQAIQKQAWWRDATKTIEDGLHGRRLSRMTWTRALEQIQSRGSGTYIEYAGVLLNYLGEHLQIEDETLPEPEEILGTVLYMENTLWGTWSSSGRRSTAPVQRKHWWKVNRKPSYQLRHPMGMLAAQGVQGDTYTCRCVHLPEGQVVAVREGDLPPTWLLQDKDGSAERSERHDGEVGTLRGDRTVDEMSSMQTTLTMMMGQQSRTRVALQGLNFRLSGLGGGVATRRALALLQRLVRKYNIRDEGRQMLPDLIQDSEATLAGHVDSALDVEDLDREDRAFVEGWWSDLSSALDYDLEQGSQQDVPRPFVCISEREQQEIKRGQEEDIEQELARQEWEEYMESKARAHKDDNDLATKRIAPARDWDDWAMWDEMNGPKLRRRTLGVTVQVGGTGGATSSSTISLPEWNGQEGITISLTISPSLEQLSGPADNTVGLTGSLPVDEGTAGGDSEATTVNFTPAPLLQMEGDTSGPTPVAATVLDSEVDPSHDTLHGGHMGPQGSAVDQASTIPWGAQDFLTDSLDDKEIDSIEDYAEKLRREFQACENKGAQQHNEDVCADEKAKFEKFLVNKAEKAFREHSEGPGK